MKWIGPIFVIAALASFAADTKDEKKDEKPATPAAQPPLSVKLSLDKGAPATAPVSFAFSIALHSYCISKGFDRTNDPDPRYWHCKEDGIEMERVPANIDEVMAAFAKDTQYIVQKGNGSTLLFFCAARSCNIKNDLPRFQALVNLLSHPTPRYFDDIDIKDLTGGAKPGDLADALPKLSGGVLTGRILASGKLRLETDAKLSKSSAADLIDKIRKTTQADIDGLPVAISSLSGTRITLPSFCLSGTLDGAAPTPGDKCTAPKRLRPAANAADIAAALTTDKVKVTADSPSSLILSCVGGPCDPKAVGPITASAGGMARPKPAYLEDLPVLPRTADKAAADIAKWSNGAITTEVIAEDLVRLKSDTPVERADVTAIHDRLADIGFGATQGLPTTRMFYSDAGTVVKGLSNIPKPPTGAPGAAAASTYGTGLTAIGDAVVLSDKSNVTDGQRVRLLTLLDLPRPEVLMNMWSLQESNPNAKELSNNVALIRNTVAIHNEALQNAIEYGWAYLSRQMNNEAYFDADFRDYITQRYVADVPNCKGKNCISADDRKRFHFCDADKYCLGYQEAFQPLKPTLTNILVGLMAAKDPQKAVFTTLGCMQGKFEIYGEECFKEREAISMLPLLSPKKAGSPSTTPDLVERLRNAREDYIQKNVKPGTEPSCQDLDDAALYAQRQCGLPVSLPLACFTVQAAKSFLPLHGFSTYSMRELNRLAEVKLADELPKMQPEMVRQHGLSFSTSPLGLLRAATTNFLFHYKMAQEFPNEFSPYLLTQSAQTLNAEFNPLVVAFNDDVSAFSADLRRTLEDKIAQDRWYKLFDPRNKSFLADGSITVRGISGIESLVDTATLSSFSAPEYQTLQSVLNNLAGLTSNPTAPVPGSSTTTSSTTQSGDATITTSTSAPTVASSGGPLSSSLTSLLPAGLAKASLPVALATAVAPTAAEAEIGRAMNLHITPHTLPGASSAELDVNLVAQEETPPTLYTDKGTAKQNDPISRVARHNVVSRVRVESVKLFEVSSFSALIQRPRTNFPLLPLPFVQIPVIGDLLSLPLPGAKVYYRSTAVVSAVIVPTAADLAYGLEFHADRAFVRKSNDEGYFMKITSQDQLPWQQRRLYPYNQFIAECFAKNGSGCFGIHLSTDVPQDK